MDLNTGKNCHLTS